MKPHERAPYGEAIVYAARAMKDGIANEGQQKAFLEWLLFGACQISALEYTPDGERASAVMSGRRLVGIQIARLFEPEALNGTTEAIARLKASRGRKQRQEATNGQSGSGG